MTTPEEAPRKRLHAVPSAPSGADLATLAEGVARSNAALASLRTEVRQGFADLTALIKERHGVEDGQAETLGQILAATSGHHFELHALKNIVGEPGDPDVAARLSLTDMSIDDAEKVFATAALGTGLCRAVVERDIHDKIERRRETAEAARVGGNRAGKYAAAGALLGPVIVEAVRYALGG